MLIRNKPLSSTLSHLVHKNRRIHFCSEILKDSPVNSSVKEESLERTKASSRKKLFKNIESFRHSNCRNCLKIMDCYLSNSWFSILLDRIVPFHIWFRRNGTNKKLLNWINLDNVDNVVLMDEPKEKLIQKIIKLNQK